MNIKQIPILYAKIGLFFLSCDGIFDEKEKLFLKAFLLGLKTSTDFKNHYDDSMDEEITSLYAKQITFDEIVSDMKSFLQEFSENDRKTILNSFTEFIKETIECNSIVEEIEKKYFENWKESFSIS